MLVTSGNAAGRLQSGKGVFDQVPRAIEIIIVEGLHEAVAPPGHDRLMACSNQTLAPPVRIVAAVTQYLGSSPWWQQGWGLCHIVALATRHHKADRIAQSVREQMDFTGQSSSGATHRLSLVTSSGSGPMCVDPYVSRINRVSLLIMGFSQPSEHPLPDPTLDPAPPAGVYAAPLGKLSRQIAPRATGSCNPKHGLDIGPVGMARASKPSAAAN